MMKPALVSIIDSLTAESIPEDRKILLQSLIDYITEKIALKQDVNLNFICTHNSRRSQFSQLWAKVIAIHYGVEINSFSGGVEITACNERTIASIERMGFDIKNFGGENPKYSISYHAEKAPLILFSKKYDDFSNPEKGFAAIMTCDHADENCPFIPGSEKRLPIRFVDPKAFDDSPKEAKMYDERSLQIATEMKYVFINLYSIFK
jgi:arsenate reductase